MKMHRQSRAEGAITWRAGLTVLCLIYSRTLAWVCRSWVSPSRHWRIAGSAIAWPTDFWSTVQSSVVCGVVWCCVVWKVWCEPCVRWRGRWTGRQVRMVRSQCDGCDGLPVKKAGVQCTAHRITWHEITSHQRKHVQRIRTCKSQRRDLCRLSRRTSALFSQGILPSVRLIRMDGVHEEIRHEW